MKNKISNDVILLIILIPLFLIASFFITSRMEQGLPHYSVINKSKQGYSVIFEALQQLNYPTNRSFNPVEFYGTDTLQIVVQNDKFDVNDEVFKNWVGRGGGLVFLRTEDDLEISYGVKMKETDEILHYNYKYGFIIVADANQLTNGTLMEDTSGAYQLLQEINRHPYNHIYINEFYLYSEANKVSLWNQIPMAWKYLIYQMGIMLAAFFYYKGKAFGKPIPLQEEVERIENEYLYASSALYRQARSWDLMLEIYYNSFLKEIKSNHEGWLEEWQRGNLPHYKKAEKLYRLLHNKQPNMKEKEYMQMVIVLDQLRNVLKKRRDASWKISQKPQ